jgi:hypothetical protein
VRVKSGNQLHAAAVLFYRFEFSGERDRYFVFVSKSNLIETSDFKTAPWRSFFYSAALVDEEVYGKYCWLTRPFRESH